MKKQYESPVMAILHFETEDIICTSGLIPEISNENAHGRSFEQNVDDIVTWFKS